QLRSRIHPRCTLFPYTTLFRSRDVAEVAEQHALRPFLDRLMERGAGADGVHEVGDVLGGHVVVGMRIETVSLLRGDGLLYDFVRSEEHTSELQSRGHLVCRLLH